VEPTTGPGQLRGPIPLIDLRRHANGREANWWWAPRKKRGPFALTAPRGVWASAASGLRGRRPVVYVGAAKTREHRLAHSARCQLSTVLALNVALES